MTASSKVVKHRIYLIQAATGYQLASTFLRFQEHYGSPRFRGRRFTLEEYMDWYAAEYGGFTYFDDWEGFNIPSWVLSPFRNGEFDPLLRKEKKLLDVSCLSGLFRRPPDVVVSA